MSREKQIEEMTELIQLNYECPHSFAEGMAEFLHDEGYRKQSEGEWVIEVNHFFDDYGNLIVYAIAHCSECKTPYRGNRNVDYERVDRPENLDYYADWSIDVEPIKKKLLERAKTLPLHKYCHECGAKMKGEEK